MSNQNTARENIQSIVAMTEAERLQNQLDAINWLVSQTHSDGMGILMRAWLIQMREMITRAGGTPQ